MPKRMKILFFWKYKIYRMFADSSLMTQLSVVTNDMNYGESILIEKGEQGPFRRAVKNHHVNKNQQHFAEAPEPSAPESMYDEVMV